MVFTVRIFFNEYTNISIHFYSLLSLPHDVRGNGAVIYVNMGLSPMFTPLYCLDCHVRGYGTPLDPFEIRFGTRPHFQYVALIQQCMENEDMSPTC